MEEKMKKIAKIALLGLLVLFVQSASSACAENQMEYQLKEYNVFKNLLYLEDKTTGETKLIGDLWETAGIRSPWADFQVLPDHDIIVIEDYEGFYSIKIVSLSSLKLITTLPFTTEEPDITWTISPKQKKIYVEWYSFPKDAWESASFDIKTGKTITNFEQGIKFDRNSNRTYFSPDGKLLYAIQFVKETKEFFRVTIDTEKDTIINKEPIWKNKK
jgi:hypothetical protein